ncbi:hypothetical protein PS2_014394 [Malus domestica]
MFCSKFNINLCFAYPAHPQSNGQVKAINKIIKRTLKTSLDKAKGCWPEFIPQVLWSYRTSYRTSTGETPFSLAFGTEAVVQMKKHLIQTEMDRFKLLASIALAPTSLETPMARPLAIHGTLIT